MFTNIQTNFVILNVYPFFGNKLQNTQTLNTKSQHKMECKIWDKPHLQQRYSISDEKIE